jgi:serine/threonine protein kinase
MKQNSILGEGTFAIVVGPYSLSFVVKTEFFQDFPKEPERYIIKIHKHEVKYPSQLFQKQQLYTQLEKQSQHHLILFPIATSIIKGKDIMRHFPFMEKTLDPSKFYQLELERYGGMSFEKVMFHKHNPVLTVSKFLKIWRCIPDILEDSFTILFHHHLIMTDIKIENIVLSSHYQLRLIDVDLNPNKRTSRIITPYITELPPQYFSQEWWHPHYTQVKNTLLQKYTKHYHEYKKEKKIISKILEFIHQYQDPSVLIKTQKLTQQENKFQRLFFVMYPLFMMVLGLFVYHCVKIQTVEEKEHVKKIVSFCLNMLQKRGHFSSTFSYKTFQDFLWKMKTL